MLIAGLALHYFAGSRGGQTSPKTANLTDAPRGNFTPGAEP